MRKVYLVKIKQAVEKAARVIKEDIKVVPTANQMEALMAQEDKEIWVTVQEVAQL